MDQKNDRTGKDELKEGLDRLDQVNVEELSDADLNTVAGGLERTSTGFTALDDVNCNSSWCCSNTSN